MGSKETYIISVVLEVKKAFQTLDLSFLLGKLDAHGVEGIANNGLKVL